MRESLRFQVDPEAVELGLKQFVDRLKLVHKNARIKG